MFNQICNFFTGDEDKKFQRTLEKGEQELARLRLDIETAKEKNRHLEIVNANDRLKNETALRKAEAKLRRIDAQIFQAKTRTKCFETAKDIIYRIHETRGDVIRATTDGLIREYNETKSYLSLAAALATLAVLTKILLPDPENNSYSDETLLAVFLVMAAVALYNASNRKKLFTEEFVRELTDSGQRDQNTLNTLFARQDGIESYAEQSDDGMRRLAHN